MSKKQDSPAKNWCFTTKFEEKSEIDKMIPLSGYIIYGEETGEGGFHHYQGYVQFLTKTRLTAIKKFAPTSHFEKQRGTADEACEYCKKDKKFIEHGEIKRERQRTDLIEIKDFIKEGHNMKELVEEYPAEFIRYNKGIEKMKNILTEERHWEMDITWIWGEAGTGKSRKAEEMEPKAYWAPPVGNDKIQWFDGYDGEDCIILDDFDGGWSNAEAKRFFDRYPLKLRIKGGFKEMSAHKIIVTSNYKPIDIWDEFDTDHKAMMRRIKKIINL